MANRRMFSLDVVDTDDFLDLPCSSRLLYYDLGMRADDDGFLNDVKKILRFTGATQDDLRILAAKGFVIIFDSGVVVVRHWGINNMIRRDRYKATLCVDERNQVLLEKSGIYSLSGDGCQLVAKRLPFGCHVGNTGEVSLGKNRVGDEGSDTPPADDDGTDLSAQIGNVQRASALIRRYGLTDSDATLEALLTDAERVGFDALEDALKRASVSDKRGGISVNYYRAILKGGKQQAEEPDPYAGVQVYGGRQTEETG